MKSILTVGLGLAVVGLARFFAAAIAEERVRRSALHHDRDTIRWEGEGGNPVTPQTALTEV